MKKKNGADKYYSLCEPWRQDSSEACRNARRAGTSVSYTHLEFVDAAEVIFFDEDGNFMPEKTLPPQSNFSAKVPSFLKR